MVLLGHWCLRITLTPPTLTTPQLQLTTVGCCHYVSVSNRKVDRMWQYNNHGVELGGGTCPKILSLGSALQLWKHSFSTLDRYTVFPAIEVKLVPDN